jgi:signal transduction histidine kinase/CheY-like chemotaxis protein
MGNQKTDKKSNSKGRWLTWVFIAGISLVVALVIGSLYWFTVTANVQAFDARMNDNLTNYRDALSTPLWNFDKPSVEQLGEAMLQGDLIAGVVVRDEDGQTIFVGNNESIGKTVLRTISVHNGNQPIGELELRFSKEPLRIEILKDIALVLMGGSILLLFGYWNWRLKAEIKLRKKVEQELHRSKQESEAANQAKSVFLANMSHELRTPLNAILGFSRLMARDSGVNEAQQARVSIINRSGEHLLSMINDILDLSKIEAGRIELEDNSFDLVALLKEISVMIQSRAGEKGLSFVLETEAVGFPYVNADAGKLRQILINLLGNAIKFTSDGSVTLRAATEPLPETLGGCRIVLEVEDTGAGIDPARQEKVFEPFVQEQGVSAQAGTGLGLSICKSLCDLMDGSIEVESELGKGALFRVRLPAGIVEAADIKTPATQPRVIGLAPGQKTRRILIADDHPDNRLVLKSLLEGAGFSIIEVENGKEALEAFEKQAPDFIWMDMRMPVMDGYEAVRQIRRRPGGQKLPIVAITASAFRSQRREILAAGCDDMVFKPFREHEIFEVMARLLGVKYVYVEPDDAAAPIDDAELTAAMLAELPPELLQDLDKTTLVANREIVLEVIKRIAEHAPGTAERLRSLVQNFEIERIRELLAEAT